MIVGLVLSLDAPPSPELLMELACDLRVTVGTPAGCRLPLVIEVAQPGEDERLIERIAEVAGGAHVDVVFVTLDDEPEAARSVDSHLGQSMKG